MINTEYISKNFEILLSNIKEYNNQVKELIELFSKSKNECNEIINNDIERSKNILDDYNDFVDKINNLQKFEIEKFVSNMINLKIAETDSNKYYENLFISNNIDQNDKNLFDNLPVITKYKTINNSSIIQEKYDNIIDIYKINRHVMKNLFAFNFILSYTQKNDIQEDKNIIRKYYKGTLIIDNVIDNPEVKAFITIPDNEILGFENKSIGPEFEIEFKYDDNNIYIMFKHTKIFRFDINENNELVDIFSDSFYKSKEIYYNIDLAFYPVDESVYIETVENETEFENGEEIPYSKITLKPIKEGFYKYINFDIDSKNIINKNSSRKYLFNSHELDKSENIEKNEYFDINKFVDFIENEFNREVEKYESQTDEYVLKINDSYSDGDKIIFATNKGLFVYLLEDNNYLNISKKWMNVYDNKLINIDYRCIGKNSDGTYYTYTDESGLINLGKNIFEYIDGSIPIDIKNIPSNNILDILTVSDIIDIKIKNDLIYLYSVSHIQENANYRIDILDFNLNRVYTKPGDYRYDSIAFDKNTYFFTNIDLKDFLKEKNLLFKKDGDNIVIFENCFIDNNIIHYEDVEPKILNIDFDQYNFSINSPFYFDEIGDKIYCIFEDNEGKIKSLEIIKNDEQYIATNEVCEISDGSIFKSIDNLYFRKDNITIVNNVGIIKTNKNKIVKIDNIKNIHNKINNILNKEIEDDNLDENVNLFYKILIYAKNKVNYSDSFDGLYKEFGIINRKDTDFDIIRTDIGTFLKEKDRDDVYYWATNSDKYEKLGNKKDRYENIRFEYIDKIPKHKIEYLELDKIIDGRARLPLADIPTDSNYKNGNNSSTPFYNNAHGIKVVSIKKQCTKMSFYYKRYNNGYVYLYIDGVYENIYTNTYWTKITIDNLTNEEHEFTWVLFSNDDDRHYLCIDTIAFNDIVETDSSKFSNIYKKELKNIKNTYKNNTNSSTPFYNDTTGFKVVSIKKQCTKMSFYYKVKSSGSEYNSIYLYIDGLYKSSYSNTSWTQAIIDNLTNKEHEFTWVLYSNSDDYYSCIDTIAFNDIVETDSSNFSNNGNIPLADIPTDSNYKNGNNSSTPFYNKTAGIKVVFIKKQCTKMSFYYKVSRDSVYVDREYNSVWLYIDGIYKSRYNTNTSWTQITINDLANEEHEFTWVLYSYDSSYYSCIDTIAFNDIIETDSSKFSNIYKKELKNIKNTYKNNTNSSTPFYNDNTGFKVVSIKKQCTKMSFYYRVSDNMFSDDSVYLYIDGIYKNKYTNDLWTQITIDNLKNKVHEFTWVLYSDSNDSYYLSIDTIAFNDIVETNSSKFSNTYEKELYIYDTYKNGINSSTPFYNDTTGFKVVSIKKRCTKMSFYYKVHSSTVRYNSVYLYIDGAYRNKYINTSWTQITINNLTDEEHEFTWVLYSHSDSVCSYIDTIAFNDIVETDSSKFSNNGNIQLANIPTDSNYKNGTNSSTPFYNNTTGIKVVYIKKRCTKMSFYYKVSRDSVYVDREYNSVWLYIDGVYKSNYETASWTQITIDNLADEEHEFTWVLYNYNTNYYSCIDTIAFNDIVFNYEVEDNNNIIDTLTNNKIKGNIDGFVTNLSYSENEIEFDYKININNVKNIFTNKNKTLIMTENKLYSSFDKILSPINKKYIPNAVSSLTNNIERTNYLKEISTYINISNIKTIKLSECCIYILTNDNKLYMCGNNILFEIPNIEQDKIINDFEKIFDNVSNIWVSDNSNIIEITKNNVKEYYISGKNNYDKYNISDKYINNYKDENLSSINNIKEIKIFENYIFVITDDNKIYTRGRNDNNIGITDMQTIFNSLQLVFENNDITEIIDIKSNKLYSIIHCKDLDKKDVYYFSGKIDDNSKKEFTKIIFNSSNDITKDVFIFDDNEYITYFIDENEVMYISNSLDKNNKLEIEYPIEKALKANNEYYLLMNSNIYIYKPLNNKLIRVIDKVYDFFVFEDSMLRIIRTDMSYGTIFLDNFKFDKEYNYGAGVYIGPNIKREHIRKIKYEINSDYMEAYYGFNYNKFGENKIYSYIYDLNNNRNKRRISDFKENSDVFGIRKRRVTNTILDNLELLDSEESEKMYSVIFELLPINPNKVLTDTVFVNDIHSNNEIKIESIVK